MGVIELLGAAVADQIAAGEVVSRPSAIVKELMENSVDAGAKNITLVIKGAGQTLTQIIDDGCGMCEDDAIMAFQRHATSKIRSADDLYSLRTFGFRGEALPSIASVAQVEMRTRTAEDELGWEIEIAGSEVKSKQQVSCPVGTSIAVRNLFFNTPARRKFLKGDSYERKLMLTEFEHVAMVNPEITFTLQNENDPPIVYRATTLRQRIAEMVKKSVDKSLLHVEVAVPNMTLKGWISNPSQAAKSAVSGAYFFVNGRYMRNASLQKAVSQAYGRILAQGQFPYFYLYIDIDPAQIDVNIHPTKTEVKFEDEQTVWHIVNSAVRKSLGSASVAPTIDFANPVSLDIPAYNPAAYSDINVPRTTTKQDYNPFNPSAPKAFSGGSSWSPAREFDPEQIPFREDIPQYLVSTGDFSSVMSAPKTPAIEQEEYEEQSSNGWNNLQEETEELVEQSASSFFVENESTEVEEVSMASSMAMENSMGMFGEIEVVDYIEPQQTALEIDTPNVESLQWNNRYIIHPTQAGLAIIDYPRALERIAFEKLQDTAAQNQSSQFQLIPEQVEVGLSDAQMLMGACDELTKLGLEISDMGGGIISVYSLPASLTGKITPQEIISELTQTLGDKRTADSLQDIIIKSLARSITRTRPQTLSESEKNNIVNQLFDCREPLYTSEGLPVMYFMGNEEVEKKFKRKC